MWWNGGRKQTMWTETGFKTNIHTYTYKVKWKSHKAKAALCSPPAAVLTCVNESSRSSFAELFGFVGQCDFYDTRDVPRRGLHTDGMRSNQLGETFGGETVIAICKGLILQLSYQLSINKALKHIVNLSMFKYNLVEPVWKTLTTIFTSAPRTAITTLSEFSSTAGTLLPGLKSEPGLMKWFIYYRISFGKSLSEADAPLRAEPCHASPEAGGPGVWTEPLNMWKTQR